MGVENVLAETLNWFKTAPSFFKATAAATTNLTSVKGSAGLLVAGYLRNRAASERYVKFYNKASAPVLANDVPVMTLGIAAASMLPLGQVLGSFGTSFPLGIAFAITGAYPDTDATAVTAGDVDINLTYL